MKKPIVLLAAFPLLLVAAAPAARADHRAPNHAEQKLLRLADEVAAGARLVHRTAAGRHGRPSHWRRARGHGLYGQRDDYTLTLLSNLDLRAHAFEDALRRRPLLDTHREFDALARSFERAAEALYRTRVSPSVERDFECLAEHMFSLSGIYEELAYPRRAFYRPYDRGHDGRIEVYGPRWNAQWRWDGRRGRDRDWDSDSDSDSY